jgi:hypothetical protein
MYILYYIILKNINIYLVLGLGDFQVIIFIFY